MRLMINTSLLRFGGAVQVALSLVHECRHYSEHEFHVVMGTGVGAIVDPLDFPANFRFHKKSFGVMGVSKLRRVQREMSVLEAEIRPDCVVTTAGPAYWRCRAPHLVGFNRPLFIYPESPRLGMMTPKARVRLAMQKRMHCWLYRREADALIVQTEDVNARVRKLLGIDKVYTVTNNHNGWYEQTDDFPARVPERAPDCFRFLTLTSYYPHKNLELIPDVINALPGAIRERVEFVLTLTEGEYRQKIGGPVPTQIKLIGPVPPPECPSLYRKCDAMFLPTLAECFSASYPEAMKMDKPIITTDLGFARSICGDAALYFEPCNANAAAGQIIRLFQDPLLQDTLRARGREQLLTFDSPAERAEKILAICAELVAERRSDSSEARAA